MSAAEERISQNGVPCTEEEFEKMVRSSPNSSFLWVQYMAFMESLGDVEKARSIAERYCFIILFAVKGLRILFFMVNLSYLRKKLDKNQLDTLFHCLASVGIF